MNNITPPTKEMMNEIFTTFHDNSTCRGSMEWTIWNSVSGAIDGNDYEALADHIKIFK